MGGEGLFRGTSSEQDVRFSNKKKKLLKQMKNQFPEEFNTSVNLKKVNIPVIKSWIARRVTELLNFEDDITINFIYNMLETEGVLDPRDIQINLTGFLAKNTKVFMKELWQLFISAQENIHGIPTSFLEQKKRELEEERKNTQRIQERLKDDEELKRMQRHQEFKQRADVLYQEELQQERMAKNPLLVAHKQHLESLKNNNNESLDAKSVLATATATDTTTTVDKVVSKVQFPTPNRPPPIESIESTGNGEEDEYSHNGDDRERDSMSSYRGRSRSGDRSPRRRYKHSSRRRSMSKSRSRSKDRSGSRSRKSSRHHRRHKHKSKRSRHKSSKKKRRSRSRSPSRSPSRSGSRGRGSNRSKDDGDRVSDVTKSTSKWDDFNDEDRAAETQALKKKLLSSMGSRSSSSINSAEK